MFTGIRRGLSPPDSLRPDGNSHDKAGRCSQWNGRLARSILTQSQLAVLRCAFPIQPHFFASTDLFQIDLSPFRFAPTALALSP